MAITAVVPAATRCLKQVPDIDASQRFPEDAHLPITCGYMLDMRLTAPHVPIMSTLVTGNAGRDVDHNEPEIWTSFSVRREVRRSSSG